MSLINDLLVNLEDRRGGQHYDSGVFAGLQAADAELARGARRYGRPVFLVIVVVGLLVSGMYFLWNQQQPVEAVDPPLAETMPRSDMPADEGTAEALSPKPERPSLKLDESLLNAHIDQQWQTLPKATEADTQPAASQPASEEQPQLQAIQLQNTEDALNIQLLLSALPEYRSYLLEAPDRLVFDLETTEFMLGSDQLPAHDWIKGIRHRRRDDELRLVFDLTRPVEIVDEQRVSDSDSNLLTLQLRAIDNNRADSKQETDAEPAAVVQSESSKGDKSAGQDAPAVVEDQHMSVTANDGGRTHGSTGLYQRAVQYYERRDYERAIQTIERHLTDAPDDVQALKLYVLALFQTNQTERADRELYEATRRLPQATELKQIYAQRLMQQGELADAVAILYESPPPVAEKPDYHALLAALLQQLGQHAESAELYQQLVQLSPERGVWWLGLAISLEAVDRNSDALTAYQQALQRELSSDLRQYVSARISALSKAQTS